MYLYNQLFFKTVHETQEKFPKRSADQCFFSVFPSISDMGPLHGATELSKQWKTEYLGINIYLVLYYLYNIKAYKSLSCWMFGFWNRRIIMIKFTMVKNTLIKTAVSQEIYRFYLCRIWRDKIDHSATIKLSIILNHICSFSKMIIFQMISTTKWQNSTTKTYYNLTI